MRNMASLSELGMRQDYLQEQAHNGQNFVFSMNFVVELKRQENCLDTFIIYFNVKRLI